MFRRTVHFALALAAGAAVTSVAATSLAHAEPPTYINHGVTTYLVNAAMIEKNDYGYRFTAGKHDSDLTISMQDGKLRYVDTGTAELRKIPKSCTRLSVPQGVGALCKIPAKWAGSKQMYLEVHPRLGNDDVDASTLPAKFRLWFLGDAGNDTMRGGAGDDFCNGAADTDRCWGGDGDDWLRSGIDNDFLYGEDGNDKLVGQNDRDVIYGGDGNDGVYGAEGNDTLYGNAGSDKVVCAGGQDEAFVDGNERANECETVNRS